MFAKILFIVVVLGVLGCALLVNRQQRIETAHRTSLTSQRLAEQERGVWRLRAEVARRCSPHRLRESTHGSGLTWAPLMLHPPRQSVAPQSDATGTDEPIGTESEVGG